MLYVFPSFPSVENLLEPLMSKHSWGYELSIELIALSFN